MIIVVVATHPVNAVQINTIHSVRIISILHVNLGGRRKGHLCPILPVLVDMNF